MVGRASGPKACRTRSVEAEVAHEPGYDVVAKPRSWAEGGTRGKRISLGGLGSPARLWWCIGVCTGCRRQERWGKGRGRSKQTRGTSLATAWVGGLEREGKEEMVSWWSREKGSRVRVSEFQGAFGKHGGFTRRSGRRWP